MFSSWEGNEFSLGCNFVHMDGFYPMMHCDRQNENPLTLMGRLMWEGSHPRKDQLGSPERKDWSGRRAFLPYGQG